MYLKPAEPIEGASAVEVWEGSERVATIYAQRAGIHLVCEPGYAPADLTVDVQRPAGLQLAIRRAD